MGLLSGAAVAWPRASPAQQGKTFRVGYLALSGRGVAWIDAWLAGRNDASYQWERTLWWKGLFRYTYGCWPVDVLTPGIEVIPPLNS